MVRALPLSLFIPHLLPATLSAPTISALCPGCPGSWSTLPLQLSGSFLIYLSEQIRSFCYTLPPHNLPIWALLYFSYDLFFWLDCKTKYLESSDLLFCSPLYSHPQAWTFCKVNIPWTLEYVSEWRPSSTLIKKALQGNIYYCLSEWEILYVVSTMKREIQSALFWSFGKLSLRLLYRFCNGYGDFLNFPRVE